MHKAKLTMMLMCLAVCGCKKPQQEDIVLTAGYFPTCDRNGNQIVQVDMTFTNISGRAISLYFPPEWGVYGGLKFHALDQNKAPLKVLNYYHGIGLPVDDGDYETLTWRLLPGEHVLLSKTERIYEEYQNPEKMRFAKIEYFSPIPKGIFSDAEYFGNHIRSVSSAIADVKITTCGHKTGSDEVP